MGGEQLRVSSVGCSRLAAQAGGGGNRCWQLAVGSLVGSARDLTTEFTEARRRARGGSAFAKASHFALRATLDKTA